MMNPRIHFLVLVISLGLFIVGCSSGETAPAATTIPTSEPANVNEEPTDTGTDVNTSEEVIKIEPIRIGVNANSIPPLTIIEANMYSGFEIDIATEIVARLYGNDATIEWVPITSNERFSSLAEGKIEMLVRGILHITSRDEVALFSGGYLLSGNSFLVFPERGFFSIADLDGENVAVLSYLVEGLNDIADELGYTFIPVAFENINEAQGALGFSRAAAIYHDWIALAGLMDNDVHTLLTVESTLGPIGIAFPLDAQDLRDEVDIVLKEMIADGTWQSIFDMWFGIPVPWNVEEMLDYPPENR